MTHRRARLGSLSGLSSVEPRSASLNTQAGLLGVWRAAGTASEPETTEDGKAGAVGEEKEEEEKEEAETGEDSRDSRDSSESLADDARLRVLKDIISSWVPTEETRDGGKY